MSNQTVRRILKDHGKDTSRKPAVVVDEDAIAQGYVEGQPVPALLTAFHINHQKLYQILKSHDIELRKVSAAAVIAIRLDRAVDMYVAGLPLWAIKNETGVSQPTLHAELHRRGIPLRHPRML